MRAIIVALLIALAGCSDGPAPVADDETLDVATTETTGAISGVIVDETITPIVDALLSLQDGSSTQSDAEGRFAFEGLAPGAYFVTATASGFLEVQASANVVAGEVAKPRIQMVRDERPEPYHQTAKFNGRMEMYATAASFALHLVMQEAGVSICDCEWEIPLDGSKPADVVIEGHWVDSIADPRGPQEYYLEVFDAGIEDCLQTGSFPSGFRTNITECDWSRDSYRVALTGPQTWVALQQEYELFVTPFYRAPAPDGWSFIAGDE